MRSNDAYVGKRCVHRLRAGAARTNRDVVQVTIRHRAGWVLGLAVIGCSNGSSSEHTNTHNSGSTGTGRASAKRPAIQNLRERLKYIKNSKREMTKASYRRKSRRILVAGRISTGRGRPVANGPPSAPIHEQGGHRSQPGKHGEQDPPCAVSRGAEVVTGSSG